MQQSKHSLSLIGMPGVGKSTIGRELATQLGFAYIDTDDLIVKRGGKSLQAYIDAHGDDALTQLETDVAVSLYPTTPTVIATGGSIVYSRAAMQRLEAISTLIYLEDSLSNIEKRINNLDSRGITGLKNKTLQEIYDERCILYKYYAQITVATHPFNPKKIAEKIITGLKK